MQRRRFNQGLISAAGLGSLPTMISPAAHAQGGLTEGRDYLKLGTPASVPSHGKVDVVEFFMYSCPHCNAFEPVLEAWVAKLPADVAFRRVPAVFGALPEQHAKMFYALESMGQLQTLHRRIFAAIHVQHRRLDKPEDIIAFVADNGVDKAAFTDAFNAFGVGAKVRQGKQLAEAYRIDGVPALGVHGRWLTSGSLTGSNERALAVVDQLIGQARASLAAPTKKQG